MHIAPAFSIHCLIPSLSSPPLQCRDVTNPTSRHVPELWVKGRTRARRKYVEMFR